MSKIRNALVFVIALMIITTAFTACGRKGNPFTNIPPVIQITSYEGVDSLAAAQTEDAILFQQKIFWEAHDPDGIVEKYAFRVVDENFEPYTDSDGNVIGTPGYSVVDEDGWVYHYPPGADESIPLEESDQKTIWTDQVYAVINFPANVNGDSSEVVSVFEVKCVDDVGEESEPANKYFKASSEIPSCNISSSKGDINGATIGTGIVFTFNIIDEDQFVGSIPDYFEFKFEKRDLLGNLVDGEEGYPDTWWSTKGRANVGSYFVWIEGDGITEPKLMLNNIENGVVQDSTYILARAIDLAGIVSEPDTVAFVVKEGFYPNTIIYNGIKQSGADNINDIVVLGSNHYVTRNPKMKIIPSVLTPTGTRYSVPFWVDKEGDYSCIHSNDLKIYMHWGYQGEYEQNDPDQRQEGKVLDEMTAKQYFSSIKYYDLRLDGEPYYYAPLPASEYNYLDPVTGKEWLRVPVASSISQEAVISGLAPGVHRFEVRAVDMQNEPDKTPSEFVFKIVEAIPASQKEGILVLNNTTTNATWAPAAIIDSLYSHEGFFADYPGTVDRLNRKWLYDNVYVSRNYTNDVFSPTDLQQYKTVIYHADYYVNIEFDLEINSLDLYLQGGGNLIISGCSNLSTPLHPKLRNNSFSILQKYFGIEYLQEDALIHFSDKIWSVLPYRSYFEKAVTNNPAYNDVVISTDNFYSQVTLPGFDPTTLATVTYFPQQYLNPQTTEVIYTFGCKAPGDDPLDPSDAEYAYYSAQPVAIKNTTAYNNKCYLFGFPLSYMDYDDASEMLINIILNEIEQ